MAEDKKVIIVTHNGHFHTDDIFAVATLLLFLDDKNTEVIRSRDKDIIEKGDFVVDVGAVYNESKNRFDHHQTGGAGKRENGIPYASFGLVWKTYGVKLSGTSEISDRIDNKLVQPIDAMDNGIQFMKSSIDGVFMYDIGEMFEAFWPSWKEGESSGDSIFNDLVSIAKNILNREIIKNRDKLEARDLVENIYKKTDDKRLIVMDRYLPANEFLNKYEEPLFIVHPKEDGTWLIKTIRIDENSYKNRKDLPHNWGGKRDVDLEKETGIEGAIFCHPSCFLAGAKTREAIVKMAEIALGS